jgi:hypothetical protein
VPDEPVLDAKLPEDAQHLLRPYQLQGMPSGNINSAF